MRVLVVHDRYDDALPNGENAVVRWEVDALSAHGIDVRLVETPRDVLSEPRWKRGLASLGGIYAPGWRRDVRARDRRVPSRSRPRAQPVAARDAVGLRCLSRHRAAVVQTLHNYRIACIADFLSRDGQRCERCLGRRVGWPGLKHRCVEGSASASAIKMTAIGVHNLLHTWERRVDTFIATTEAMRATFARAGLPADRIRVKPSCAPDRGASDRERRYFCFAGRLSREKGIEALLDGWSTPACPSCALQETDRWQERCARQRRDIVPSATLACLLPTACRS
jgi:glycosyltransferase involved in cell wall biosynthesis